MTRCTVSFEYIISKLKSFIGRGEELMAGVCKSKSRRRNRRKQHYAFMDVMFHMTTSPFIVEFSVSKIKPWIDTFQSTFAVTL